MTQKNHLTSLHDTDKLKEYLFDGGEEYKKKLAEKKTIPLLSDATLSIIKPIRNET